VLVLIIGVELVRRTLQLIIVGVVGLVCEYHSQVIDWKDSPQDDRYVSSETLNSTRLVTQ